MSEISDCIVELIQKKGFQAIIPFVFYNLLRFNPNSRKSSI
jgi:hypothetical protein